MDYANALNRDGASPNTSSRTIQDGRFREIQEELRNTLPLKSEDGSFETNELFAYLKYVGLYDAVFGIQRFTVNKVHVAEITLKYEANLTEFSSKLFAKPLIINGNTPQLTPTRIMKDIIRNPVTKVLIFEAPFQFRGTYIIQKLAQYGQLQSNEMFMHKYRGTEIYNGVGSVNFLKIDKPVPTTMFVKRNRVRLRHEDQDRTPICRNCRVRGHYGDKCPTTTTTAQRPVEYTDVDNSPPLSEAGTEMRANWRKATAKQAEVQKNKEEEEAKKLYIQRQLERKEAEEHRMRAPTRRDL